MEKKKSFISINIVLLLTNIFLGIIALLIIVFLIFNIILYTDLYDENIGFSIPVPLNVDFSETGTLDFNNQDFKVKLQNASAQIHIFNTPELITKCFGILVLLASLFTIYLVFVFRKFIVNVKEGNIFTSQNISLLKRISYGFAICWLVKIVYMCVLYRYISNGLKYDGIVFTESVNIFDNFITNNLGYLIAAIIIWVLAHIFDIGFKLHNENKLTI